MATTSVFSSGNSHGQRLQRVGSNLAYMHASRGTKIMPAILYASLVAQLVKNLPAVQETGV